MSDSSATKKPSKPANVTAGERVFDLDFILLRVAANALKRAADTAEESVMLSASRFNGTRSGALHEEALQSISAAMDLVDSAYSKRVKSEAKS